MKQRPRIESLEGRSLLSASLGVESSYSPSTPANTSPAPMTVEVSHGVQLSDPGLRRRVCMQIEDEQHRQSADTSIFTKLYANPFSNVKISADMTSAKAIV